MNKYSITSNTPKLLKHLDHLKTIQDKKSFPLMVVVCPTNKCNMKCLHCCFSGRDLKQEMTIDFLKDSLYQLKQLGTKSIELTGGGEPTVYKHFNELVLYIHRLGFNLGMNTNGLKLKDILNLEYYSWIRLSLNWFDFPNLVKKYYSSITETIPLTQQRTKLTACYVVPQTIRLQNIEQVIRFAEKNKLKTRITPDCIMPKDKLKIFIDEIKDRVKDSEYCFVSDFNIFLGERPNNFCAEHYLKPCLFSDGWLYPCPSSELSIENGADLINKFKICRGTEIYKYYTEKFETFTHTCSYCKYTAQNNLIQELLMDTEFNEFV